LGTVGDGWGRSGTVGDGRGRLGTVGYGWGRDGDGGVTVGDGTVTVTVMDGDAKGQGSEESLYDLKLMSEIL
jgi:hypothetical protein